MGLSLKPSEMGVGGGLWGDIDGTISGAAFVLSDYDGKAAAKVPVFELTVVDGEGEEHEQLISAGRGKFTPSADGKRLEGEGKLNIGSNFGLLITSLINAGFPENKLEDDISVLVGLNAHFDRVPAPERKGLKKAPRADGKVYEETVLVVTKIHSLPWDKKGKGAPAGKGGKAPAGKAPAADDLAEKVKEIVLNVLIENPEGVTKQQLSREVFKVVSTDPDKAAIVKMAVNDEFLSANWTLEDGVVSM